MYTIPVFYEGGTFQCYIILTWNKASFIFYNRYISLNCESPGNMEVWYTYLYVLARITYITNNCNEILICNIWRFYKNYSQSWQLFVLMYGELWQQPFTWVSLVSIEISHINWKTREWWQRGIKKVQRLKCWSIQSFVPYWIHWSAEFFSVHIFLNYKSCQKIMKFAGQQTNLNCNI